MGRQINFYMDKDIQDKFIQYLEQNGFKFLDYSGVPIEQIRAHDGFDIFLYKQHYGEIFMRQDNERLDILKSSVIEFTKTRIKSEEKKVLRGRLWMSGQYNDEVSEEGRERLLKDYTALTRWIRKHVPYQEIKKGDYFVKEYASDELKSLQEKGFILTL